MDQEKKKKEERKWYDTMWVNETVYTFVHVCIRTITLTENVYICIRYKYLKCIYLHIYHIGTENVFQTGLLDGYLLPPFWEKCWVGREGNFYFYVFLCHQNFFYCMHILPLF